MDVLALYSFTKEFNSKILKMSLEIQEPSIATLTTKLQSRYIQIDRYEILPKN